MPMFDTRSIIVPVRGRSDVIEIFLHELPFDPSDVVEMLRSELAPLEIWCEFAMAYYKRGDRRQFREILLGVVDAFDVYEMQDYYRAAQSKFTDDRLRILNLLAASATLVFVSQVNQEIRSDWKQKALEYIGRADKIQASHVPTKLCKSLFWLGELHHDSNALRNARYYTDLAVEADGRKLQCPVLETHVRVLLLMLKCGLRGQYRRKIFVLSVICN
mmetsp:Transcript_17683/g.55359  ORF Transcript_17683/g.55359 Transcript_17683/m.55359 type:complete len:217 (+) Transcript_17683:81-731(+)